MKKLLTIVLSVFMVLSLAACGSKEQTVEPVEEDSAVKVGVIYTVAGLGGASFNDVIHEGCLRAEKELGAVYQYVEPETIADEETAMDDMCAGGEYDLLICVGNEQKDAVANIAAKYPEQKFCYIDASVDLPNIANYECLENEGGFLIGVLCAMAEEEGLSDMFNAEKKFGFLGGVNNPIINRFASGFLSGAKYVNPDYTMEINYVGGFGDPTTAKGMAETFYEKGCDVVFHAAGGSGTGMFNAASEKGFIAVGVNTNQNGMAPDYIIASMLKRVDNAAFDAIKSVADDTFTGGTVTLTLADGGVGYTNEASNIKLSDTIVAALAEVEKGIIDGSIVVPQTIEEAEAYVK